MKFPIIIIKDKEAPIYFINENEFGLVSQGGETFYKKGSVYDSEGNKYLINGVRSIKKAPLLKSIRYFQRMYIVDIKYEKISDNINLSDFKQIIIDHIHSYKKYWLSRDTFADLRNAISDKNNFCHIITFLK